MSLLKNPSRTVHDLCAYWLTSRSGLRAKVQVQHTNRTSALLISSHYHKVINSGPVPRSRYSAMPVLGDLLHPRTYYNRVQAELPLLRRRMVAARHAGVVFLACSLSLI